MIRPGTLALRGTRTTPLDYVIEFRGIDLTGAEMAAQVRQKPDNPGDPELDLADGVSTGVTGVRLIEVGTTGGVAFSRVGLFVEEDDMSALPAAASVGDTLAWYWDLKITPDGGVTARYLAGAFYVEGGSTVGGGTSTGSGSGVDAIVNVSDESIVVEVSGAQVLGELLDRIEDAVEEAEAAVDQITGIISLPDGDAIFEIRPTAGLNPNGGGYPYSLRITREAITIVDTVLPVADLVAVIANAAVLGSISFADTDYALLIRATAGLNPNGGGAPVLAAIAKGLVLDASFIGLPGRVTAIEDSPAASGAVYGEPWADARIDFERVPTFRFGLPQHGQSNSIGPEAVLLSTTAHTGVKMLGSIRRVDVPATGQAWTANSVSSWGGLDLPAAEAVITASGNTYGETGAVVRANTFLDHVSRFIGANPEDFGQTLVIGATGAGGRTANELINGSYYDYLTDWMTHAVARAAAAGLSLRVPSVLYDNGEQDMSVGTAKATYKGYVAGFPAKVKASQTSIASVTKPVPCGIFQTAQHGIYAAGSAELAAWNIAMAQRELAEKHADFFFAGSTYAWAYSDTAHLHALGEAIKYARAGLAQAQLAALGIRPPHLRVIRATWTATGIELQYAVPVGRLVLDTVQINNPTGFWYGGTILNASNAVVPITSAGLKDGTTDTVVWETGGAPATGWQFYLGRAGKIDGVFGGAGIGPTSGARTCIRDQAGDRDTVTIEGEDYPLHNWSPFYEFTHA